MNKITFIGILLGICVAALPVGKFLGIYGVKACKVRSVFQIRCWFTEEVTNCQKSVTVDSRNSTKFVSGVSRFQTKVSFQKLMVVVVVVVGHFECKIWHELWLTAKICLAKDPLKFFSL